MDNYFELEDAYEDVDLSEMEGKGDSARAKFIKNYLKVKI